MGTNYYLKLPDKPCAHCGRSDPDEGMHIGKSSFGWCFALHVIPERGINDLDDWLPLFERGEIRDEYDESISPAEMLSIITKRGRVTGEVKPRDPAWYAANYAEPGPNGLARHAIRQAFGHGCIKQGAGTWDCITGDFS